MFKTKRIASTTSLVLMLLGMMAVFQSDEAESNHSSWWCPFTSHNSFPIGASTRWTTISTWTQNTNCSVCNWSSQTYPHTVALTQQEVRSNVQWTHWVLLPIPGHVNCHVHHGPWTPTGLTSTIVMHCNNHPG